MRNYLSLLAISLLIIHSSSGQRQRAPMYYSAYAYLYTINSNQPTELYMEEDLWKENIDYISEHLAPLGFDMIATDGWGEAQKDDNGFLVRHHPTWDSSYAEWSAYSNQIGVKIGMYDNPLWINSEIESTKHLMDSTANDIWFKWIKINEPGGPGQKSAETYLVDYFNYYANTLNTDYLRVDFLSWYEDGIDKSNCYTSRNTRPIGEYQKALGLMDSLSKIHDIQLSLVMPHLYNDAETERTFAPGSMIRINEDVTDGGWWRLSEIGRGREHQIWSKYHNTFDGLTYWSSISGFDDSQEKREMILDGDFIWLSSFESEEEKKSALSINLMAGGAIALTEFYIEDIERSLYLLENEEVFALNREGFVGKPINLDPNDIVASSERWAGKMPGTNEYIVCLFNRDDDPKPQTINFSEIDGFGGGTAYVRDLWERKDFIGAKSSFTDTIPGHGCIMLKLSPSISCTSQTISFDSISDQSGNAEIVLSDISSEGLPISYSISQGRGTINNNGNDVYTLKLGNETGTVKIIASQPGNENICPAESITQVFNVNGVGEHDSTMFIGGTFNGWSPGRFEMRLQNEIWTIRRLFFESGVNYDMKFVSKMDYSGNRYGNSNGTSGTAVLLQSGEDNHISFSVNQTGYYKVTFNDISLSYEIVLEENGICSPQPLEFNSIGNLETTDGIIDLSELVVMEQHGKNVNYKVNFSLVIDEAPFQDGHSVVELCRKQMMVKSCPGQVKIEAVYNGSDQFCPVKVEQTFTVSNPSGAVQVDPGETYSIVSKLSRERYDANEINQLSAIDLFEGSSENGTNLHQWEFFPALETQHWEVTQEDNCLFSLLTQDVASTDMAIDVAGESRDDGGNIHLWEYYEEGEHDNQKWRIEWVTSEIEESTQITRHYYRIISKYSEKAIDIYQGLAANGTNIHQWEYFGGSSQLWEFVPVSSSGNRVDVSHEPTPTNAFNIYPNPTTTNGKLFLRNDFESMGSVNMTITDMSGNIIIHEQMMNNGSEMTMDLSIDPGLYLVVLDHDGKRESHKVLIE